MDEAPPTEETVSSPEEFESTGVTSRLRVSGLPIVVGPETINVGFEPISDKANLSITPERGDAE
jgi:hypothetical protein